MLVKENINKFITEYNFKYKSKPIYLWSIILISYYNNRFEMIIDIYKKIQTLTNKRIKVLENLINNHDIFFEEYIIDFFYKLKFKNYKFEIYNFIIESLMLISQVKGNINYIYLVFFSKLSSNKNQIECLKELLVFNNMVVNYLKD